MNHSLLPQDVERRAEDYIDQRIASFGVPFPFIGPHRALCAKLMAAFACGEVVKALTDIFGNGE